MTAIDIAEGRRWLNAYKSALDHLCSLGRSDGDYHTPEHDVAATRHEAARTNRLFWLHTNADALLDALEAERQDAERYRWLRYRMTSLEAAPMRELTGVKLDRAIDSAMSREGGE